MTTNDNDHPAVRRVLLGLEPGGLNARSLELALELSRGLKAELTSLMIEDVALARAAALPFTREIARNSGEDRPLDPALLARGLRARLDHVREELAREAGERGVAWSLRTIRGAGPQAALEELGRSDVLVLGRAPRVPWSPGAAAAHAVQLYTEDADLKRIEARTAELVRGPADLLSCAIWQRLRWSDADAAIAALKASRPRLVMLPAAPFAGRLRLLIDVLDCPLLVVW